jgi:hypothetical protein
VRRSDLLVVAVRATTVVGAVGFALTTSCTDGPGSDSAFASTGLARATCDKLIECGCIDSAEGDACQAELVYLFQPPYEYYQPPPCYDYYCAHGYDTDYEGPVQLAFDPQCAADLEAGMRQLDCRQIPFDFECENYCPLYHGTHWQGQRCTLEDNFFVTDCAKGLACIAGECRNPCDVVVALEGQSCELLECAPGLSCEYIESDPLEPGVEICTTLPQPGQPCLSGDCAEGAWCDFSDPMAEPVCQRLQQLGEPCSGHAQCDSFNCPAGFCAAPPQLGDPCSSTLPCAPGQGCEDGVCVEQWALCGLFAPYYDY